MPAGFRALCASACRHPCRIWFTSLKVGIAAALVGTIVGELPTGAISGLGARILIGDQFGTPLAIWSALFAAAVLAGALVTLLDLIQRITLKRMGMAT